MRTEYTMVPIKKELKSKLKYKIDELDLKTYNDLFEYFLEKEGVNRLWALNKIVHRLVSKYDIEILNNRLYFIECVDAESGHIDDLKGDEIDYIKNQFILQKEIDFL